MRRNFIDNDALAFVLKLLKRLAVAVLPERLDDLLPFVLKRLLPI